MTITQLQYVMAVAEYRNFTLAAEKSFVTQPTLSMQVQKLEEELDILIFDRSKKPIALTEAGKRVIDQARHIINEANRIKDIVAQEKGFIGGDFKVGIIPTVMPTILPMFLKTFINKYPRVNLEIREQPTETLIRNLQEGNIDAGIAATPLEVEFIKERVLYYEPFVGYVPDGHRLVEKNKLQREDLDINDILLLEDGHCFRDGVINLCASRRLKESQRFELYSGSFETLISLSDEGMGMTLLPYLNSLHVKNGKSKHIKSFENPPPAREVSLIYHKNELKIQIIDALHEVITSVIKGAIAFEDVEIVSPISR